MLVFLFLAPFALLLLLGFFAGVHLLTLVLLELTLSIGAV